MAPCEEHSAFCEKIGKLIESNSNLHESLDKFMARVEQHITEGEKPGGVRSRVSASETEIALLKKEISTIKQGYWKVGLASGFVGAIIGTGSADAISSLIKWFIGR